MMKLVWLCVAACLVVLTARSWPSVQTTAEPYIPPARVVADQPKAKTTDEPDPGTTDADPNDNGGAMITSGHCTPASILSTGSADADLTKTGKVVSCRAAVITFWVAQNRVLIQFAGAGQNVQLVGFSGNLFDGEIKIDQMQLNGGEMISANEGFCKIRGVETQVESVFCVGKIRRQDVVIGSMIQFIADPNSTTRY